VQGTAEGPHPSAAAHLSEAAVVFDAATALDTATDMVDPQPRLVELLVRHVLLPRKLLPQIEINSIGNIAFASPLHTPSAACTMGVVLLPKGSIRRGTIQKTSAISP